MESATGDGFGRGWSRWKAGARPHPMVQVGLPGTACRGESSGQKRRPELGSSGSGALVRARANGAASSLPGDAVSMLVLLRRAGEVGSAGLAGHGGGGARELVGQRLEGERDKGRRGKTLQASQRIFWCGRRARGGPVAGESTTAAVKAEDEDGDGGDAAGLLRSRASVCSSTESWRSSWWCWLGGWWLIAMATTMACSRAHGKRGRGSQRRGERGEALGVSVASRGCRGGCHREAGGGGLCVRACARATSPLPTCRG